MIIIETCPECGHDLVDSVICTNPPIPRKECHNCGWIWEGQREEEVVRVPFTENKIETELIHTQGLAEGIRCAMCTNIMKSDMGCDGGCYVNEKMYSSVMNIIDMHTTK